MPGQQTDENYISHTFHIRTEDIEAFRLCGNSIVQKSQNNEPVPSELIKEFISYIITGNDKENKRLKALCTKAYIATVDYFPKLKDYQFKSRKKGKLFDFESCINYAITYYAGDIWINQLRPHLTEKRKCIETIFKGLTIYSRPWNKSKDNLLISHYKKTVIAAFITHHLDIHVHSPGANNKFNLQELYKAGWDSVKHLTKMPSFQKYFDPRDIQLHE